MHECYGETNAPIYRSWQKYFYFLRHGIESSTNTHANILAHVSHHAVSFCATTVLVCWYAKERLGSFGKTPSVGRKSSQQLKLENKRASVGSFFEFVEIFS